MRPKPLKRGLDGLVALTTHDRKASKALAGAERIKPKVLAILQKAEDDKRAAKAAEEARQEAERQAQAEKVPNMLSSSLTLFVQAAAEAAAAAATAAAAAVIESPPSAPPLVDLPEVIDNGVDTEAPPPYNQAAGHAASALPLGMEPAAIVPKPAEPSAPIIPSPAEFLNLPSTPFASPLASGSPKIHRSERIQSNIACHIASDLLPGRVPGLRDLIVPRPLIAHFLTVARTNTQNNIGQRNELAR